MANRTPTRPGNLEVSAALERLLASPSFARSSRLASFLRFIVNERLSGNQTPLKEYVLGVQVFGRDPNYDPRIDPIVRVQARQLRFKLREYYETAGLSDPIRIEIPKGSYLPEIAYAAGTERDQPLAQDPSPQLAPSTVIAPPAQLPPSKPWKTRWVSVAALIAAIALAGVLFARLARPGSNSSAWPNRLGPRSGS